MKSALMILVLVFSSSAFATPSKICFGTGDNRGDGFVMKANLRNAVLSEPRGQLDWIAGTYPREGQIRSRDNKVFMTFDLGNNDGSNTLIVDPVLLRAGTQGSVKIRNRGEGFYQYNFICRDRN